MNKSAALLAAVLLAACASPPPPPPPVVAVVKAKQDFPPRPLTLLYTTFQDHAVIQRGKPIPVWGLTAPGASVEVSLGLSTANAIADSDGHWRAVLPAMNAGGPYVLAAKSSAGTTQSLKDIMLGDVYLCSGQSNMELPLRLATNYDGEMRGAKNAMIRLFHVQRFTSPLPKTTFGADASWSVTTPENVKEFSATCYYFGREVQPVAGVALGLIEDAWGGAAIQAWISGEKLATLGYGGSLDILKTYAASPKDGERAWLKLVDEWVKTHDPAMTGSPAWFDPALDDSAWSEDVAIGGWRSWKRLAKFDGMLWMRKTVDLSEAEAAGAATLSLGTIEGNDLAFVNGTEVGTGEGYDVARVYSVPAGTLHQGKNVLVVAVQMGGGFLDPADKMSLKFSDGTSKPLTGPWKWKTSVARKETGRLPHQPWLNQFGASTLYNGMIVPLGDTQIRGILWYQGESDTWQPKEYARLMRGLVDDWRAKFGADTPFYAVQLPSFGDMGNKPAASDWANLREVQRQVVNDTPNTGLAVTIDLGSPDNIHPAAKQEVGRRLALFAKKYIYGKDLVAASPSPLSVTRKGSKITVTFEHVATGLVARNWDRVIGFTLCDAAGDCRYADGILSKDKIVLDARTMTKAVSVRYCWADSPMCNLYSPEGLPAVPFEQEIAGKKLTRTARHRDFKAAATSP